ncbi:DNA-directed RNA polymerase I subunit RPA34 isoform X1 [Hippocampus comes]|uniref:DNA-directed RNA polymerase I subunit RPA34 isoform X1 n=1 Tax=Hippocampus comes TaxID=109280 RepID=UPI00094E0FD7|nr:PREDICTED: DNA-directed RNA polymerase I subunit RPA34 isoform X1 [Hippocampus comes]
MPGDVSSSSSEDEASHPPAEASFRQKHVAERSSKYQCPDDFVCFSHKPCSNTLTESLKSSESELWLIKAPANFDPRCLRGASVNLSGFQTLKLPSASAAGEGHGQQVYNILASNHGTADLRLLTAASSSPVVGPAFSGLLSVCESYGGARAPPCVVHAPPAPAIPPGLKQRFQPFGSKTPTTAQETQDEDRKRKKKKKKDKHIKKEEEVRVKQEVEETGQEHTEEESSRKRKKVKEEVAVVQVKQELKRELDVGALYNDDSSAKKKKKRKKSKMDAE